MLRFNYHIQSAVIRETLRLGNGFGGKLPRTVPAEGLHISSANITIPPGTRIAMSPYLTHSDPRIYPEPHKFIPERWLGEEGKELDKYLLSFSKGSRICAGMQ